MNIEQALRQRADSRCELCHSDSHLGVYEVPPVNMISTEHCVLVCATCREQIEDPEKMTPHHWHCLNETMWSQEPAVQVLAWRLLNRLRSEAWSQELLDILYLEESVQHWAEAETDLVSEDEQELTRDSNGAVLNNGDNVIIIKDLAVKGARFTAKRGTVVRNISLTPNPEHIEGRVNGTRIVLLSCFLKKQMG